MGALSGFTVPVVKEEVDDFRYLSLMAQRYSVSFFAVAGELIFDNVVGNSSPIISFTVGTGLIDFQKRLSLQGQVGEVGIWGRDVTEVHQRDCHQRQHRRSGKKRRGDSRKIPTGGAAGVQ